MRTLRRSGIAHGGERGRDTYNANKLYALNNITRTDSIVCSASNDGDHGLFGFVAKRSKDKNIL